MCITHRHTVNDFENKYMQKLLLSASQQCKCRVGKHVLQGCLLYSEVRKMCWTAQSTLNSKLHETEEELQKTVELTHHNNFPDSVLTKNSGDKMWIYL